MTETRRVLLINWDILETATALYDRDENEVLKELWDNLHGKAVPVHLDGGYKIGTARDFRNGNNGLTAEVTIRKGYEHCLFSLDWNDNGRSFVVVAFA
jgi:hypothetical protein